MVENRITYGFFHDGETVIARCRPKWYVSSRAVIPSYIGCRSSTSHLLKSKRDKTNDCKKSNKENAWRFDKEIGEDEESLMEIDIEMAESNESIHPY